MQICNNFGNIVFYCHKYNFKESYFVELPSGFAFVASYDGLSLTLYHMYTGAVILCNVHYVYLKICQY